MRSMDVSNAWACVFPILLNIIPANFLKLNWMWLFNLIIKSIYWFIVLQKENSLKSQTEMKQWKLKWEEINGAHQEINLKALIRIQSPHLKVVLLKEFLLGLHLKACKLWDNLPSLASMATEQINVPSSCTNVCYRWNTRVSVNWQFLASLLIQAGLRADVHLVRN